MRSARPSDDGDSVDARLDALDVLSLEEVQHRIHALREQEVSFFFYLVSDQVLTFAQRTTFKATANQHLGSWTVACLILNRVIGTGIFVQPGNILFLTGSSGVAILVWAFAGIITLLITLGWLELGLTVPRYFLGNGRDEVSVLRSGGDKNYACSS